MGIRIIATISLAIHILLGNAQTELQRKYDIQKLDEFKSFILSSGKTDSLSTYFHSKDTYSDIYLDSPDFLLLRNKLSLRFRRRISGTDSTIVSYSFQLKNEMDSAQSIRMEVEESDLFLYDIKDNENWVSLTSILDTLFYHKKNANNHKSADITSALALLESWIEFKAESAITPFQKLIHLKIGSIEEIKKIKPICYGNTIRYRSHIYTNKRQSSILGIEPNRLKSDQYPNYFKENPQHLWVAESSLDYSTFYFIDSQTHKLATIIEFEVENKYPSLQEGLSLMKVFENNLTQTFQAREKTNSKYKQSMDTWLTK